MLGKYINQFMADNELSVNEEFFIENMDGNRVLIGCADRYKKVTALSKKKTMIGEVYVVELQERLSNGKYRYFWREIYVDMLTGQERCYYRGNKQGCIEPYDKERV